MKRFTISKFFVFLALLDILIFFSARILRYEFGITHYRTVELDWFIAARFLFTIFLVIFIIMICEFYTSNIKKVRTNPRHYQFFLLLALVLYIALSLSLLQASRYEDGGLTGINYVLYSFKTLLLSFISFSLLLNNNLRKTKYYLLLFLAISLATADGLSNTLFAFSLMVLYLKLYKAKYLIPFVMFSSLGLWFGINQKFSSIPDYFGFEFFLSWTFSRFSISTEAFLLYLDGQSVMSSMHFIDFIFTRLDEFLKYFSNGDLYLYAETYPSVGANVYYDLYGLYKGGASPGLWYTAHLLNVVFLGPYLFFIIKLLSSFFKSSTYELKLSNFFFFYILFLPTFSNPINALNMAPNLFFLLGLYFALLYKPEV